MQAKRKYFQLLGIEPTSDLKAIKKAYRLKALALHPDRNPSDQAQIEFIELTEAYEILIGIAPIQGSQIDNVKSAEEIRAEKLERAKAQYMKMQALEKEKDEIYFVRITNGWRWKTFKIFAIYSFVFSLILSADYFLTRTTKATNEITIYGHIPRMIKLDGELFEIDNEQFWHSDWRTVSLNYSFFFNDLKSINIIKDGFDLSMDRREDHVKKFRLFDQYDSTEIYSYSSVYYLFPFIHLFFFLPLALVYLKRPTLNFEIGRLVSIWVIFPCIVFLSLSNGRLLHLFGLL